MSAASAPAVVDVTPYRSAIAGEGENEHLMAILTASQAYGTWWVNALDFTTERRDFSSYPASSSQPGLSREEAVALARGWVTGELTREDLAARTQR